MKSLILASMLFVFWCIAFAIIWFSNLYIQSLGLLGATILYLAILGGKSLLAQFRVLLPFLGMLTAVYALFILLGIDPSQEGAFRYWLAYGLPRALLLVNAFLAFRLCFSIVSVDGLLQSRMSIHRLKYIVLGKILYEAAVHSYRDLKNWQYMIPSMRGKKPNLREKFKRNLCATLALVLYVLAEAELKGERIDNLIKNCYEETQ